MKAGFLAVAMLCSATALHAQAEPGAGSSRAHPVIEEIERTMANDTAGTRPDFSAVDSREKAEELFRRGELEKVYLFPLEFGGPDEDVNVVYLPVGLGAMKTRIDMEVVQPLAEEGRITSYTATPEYQGRSFIPVSIRIRASDPGDFTYTLAIWGEALASDEGN